MKGITLAALWFISIIPAPVMGQARGIPNARDAAYKLAAKMRVRGFVLYPAFSGDNSKEVQEAELQVQKGMDYYFVVAVDDPTEIDTDIYVQDSEGTPIRSDNRGASDAAVQWTSQFNGTVVIKIVLGRESKKNGKSFRQYYCLSGVRTKDAI